MSKQIHLHAFRTGRLKRWGYYTDLRSAACAQALLREWGWKTGEIKYLDAVNRYKVYAEAVNHRPTLNEYTLILQGEDNLGKIKNLPRQLPMKKKVKPHGNY